MNDDRALVIVDVQNDFVDGTLAVPEAAEVLPVIRSLAHSGGYKVVAGTRDWHPENHVSFADEPEYVDGSWPRHCVRDSDGAQYAPTVRDLIDHDWHYVKGDHVDMEEYSGGWARNARTGRTTLSGDLSQEGIKEIDVVGLALDYCVLNTALDLAVNGQHVRVLLDGTRAVTAESGSRAIDKLKAAGVEVVR